jgi:hypothetical protein
VVGVARGRLALVAFHLMPPERDTLLLGASAGSPARSGKLCCNDRAKGHVALLSEAMMHDAAIASDQNAGRRSLHSISPHGNGYRRALGRFIDSDWKAQPVFVDKRFQRYRRHGGVMFKHGVQSDDLEVGMFEEVEGALRLRGSVSDASRTQHLKRMQKNRPAS